MDKVLVLKATENGTVGVEMPFDKEAGLDFYYQNLDCDTIDIVEAHGLVRPHLLFENQEDVANSFLKNNGYSES